ncbi:hypothetical protein, partial [Streptomyces sp. NPDC127098]|uniref:hypothetical protein n=1 Tax=Streptomyces sp. NPDC127098 TaxID=3347137 RepID=UPI00365571D2
MTADDTSSARCAAPPHGSTPPPHHSAAAGQPTAAGGASSASAGTGGLPGRLVARRANALGLPAPAGLADPVTSLRAEPSPPAATGGLPARPASPGTASRTERAGVGSLRRLTARWADAPRLPALAAGVAESTPTRRAEPSPPAATDGLSARPASPGTASRAEGPGPLRRWAGACADALGLPAPLRRTEVSPPADVEGVPGSLRRLAGRCADALAGGQERRVAAPGKGLRFAWPAPALAGVPGSAPAAAPAWSRRTPRPQGVASRAERGARGAAAPRRGT